MRCSLWMWCCQHFYATINLAPIWNLTNLKWNSKSQWNLLTRRWWELRLVTGAKHPWIRNVFFFFLNVCWHFLHWINLRKNAIKYGFFFFFLNKMCGFFFFSQNTSYLFAWERVSVIKTLLFLSNHWHEIAFNIQKESLNVNSK